VLDGHELAFIFIEPKEPLSLKEEEVEIKEIPATMCSDALVLGTPVKGGEDVCTYAVFPKTKNLIRRIGRCLPCNTFFQT